MASASAASLRRTSSLASAQRPADLLSAAAAGLE
jgi:hypothetical protein